jgi:hypothetical protein
MESGPMAAPGGGAAKLLEPTPSGPTKLMLAGCQPLID